MNMKMILEEVNMINIMTSKKLHTFILKFKYNLKK